MVGFCHGGNLPASHDDDDDDDDDEHHYDDDDDDETSFSKLLGPTCAFVCNQLHCRYTRIVVIIIINRWIVER